MAKATRVNAGNSTCTDYHRHQSNAFMPRVNNVIKSKKRNKNKDVKHMRPTKTRNNRVQKQHVPLAPLGTKDERISPSPIDRNVAGQSNCHHHEQRQTGSALILMLGYKRAKPFEMSGVGHDRFRSGRSFLPAHSSPSSHSILLM